MSWLKFFQSYPTSEEVMQIYDKMARDIEQHLQHVIGVPGTNPLYAQMTNLLETVLHARNSRDVQSSMALLQKVRVVLMLWLSLLTIKILKKFGCPNIFCNCPKI